MPIIIATITIGCRAGTLSFSKTEKYESCPAQDLVVSFDECFEFAGDDDLTEEEIPA